MFEGDLLQVAGLEVGQVENSEARTGVTAILCRAGAIGGVDVRGAAPGTRETDLLRPDCAVDCVHAVLLCGGSAFGLAAAQGAMSYLEAQQIGLPVAGVVRVPIVCAAVLFDLTCGRADIRPDEAMGEAACAAAGGAIRQGRYGAGCGATVGKLLPGATPAPGGLGSASLTLPGGAHVAAIVAVNAAGDIYHPHTGALLACGQLNGYPVRAMDVLFSGAKPADLLGGNTTIGVIATDAKLSKAQANRLATVAHDGYARAIRPAHTNIDGDTIFALATGHHSEPVDLVVLHAAAAEVMARAIVNAVEASR